MRVLDLGLVPAVRSQTVYHAVGHTLTVDTPDTIILVAPAEPYVCIGYHQDLEAEVDTSYCTAHDLPIYRREVGGGAVYLDSGQVFVQWVFHPDSLPPGLEEQFELYIRPLVDTYRSFGIDAYWRPVNDIHVDHRKIGGTGAADMGEARVLVGSLMLDFDKRTMARVLRVPSEKMRDKVYAGLEEYMTTMTEQLGAPPDREEVVARYLAFAAEALGRELRPGPLTGAEERKALELDIAAVDPEWLYRRSPLRTPGVKIHQDVNILSGMHKAPGGLIRVTARTNAGRLEDISFSGDFTVLPALTVAALESAAEGAEPTAADLEARFGRVYQEIRPSSPGVGPADFARALLAAVTGEPGQ